MRIMAEDHTAGVETHIAGAAANEPRMIRVEP
jgi:hypothetical protein